MGHVQRRGPGRWRARYRGPDGHERSKTFARKSDGERWLAGIESSKLRGDWLDPSAGRLSLHAFASEWVEGVRHLRPSTLNRYESLLRCHILPALGAARLNAIQPQDVGAFVSDLIAQGLSPTTVRHAFVLLSVILREAQRDGRLGRNPATGVSLPPRPRVEQRYLTAEELWRLAESIGPEYRALVLTGGYAGLRWGELVGLRIGRLRLLERKIDVIESIVEVGGHLVPGLPKTVSHTVSIPTPLLRRSACIWLPTLQDVAS